MLCRSVCGVAAAMLSFVGFATAFAGVNAFTPLGPEGGPVSKVEFHPTDGAVAYLATSSGFHRSTDAGVSWQLAAGSPVDRIVDFAIDPNDGSRVFVAAINHGLFVSTDAGATLSRLTTFQFNQGPSNVEMSRDGTLYATAGTRVFLSTDGGAGWQERTPIVTSSEAALRVDPLASNRLYVFNGTDGLRSTDGGTSWSSFSLPAQTRDLVVAAVTPPLLFAGTFAGVMVSSNGGANWSPVGLADATLALAIDAADAATVYAGTYPTGLFRTTNQGGQWSNVHGNARSGEIASIAVSRVQPGLVLLGGNEGLVRSTTAGSLWTSANSGFISTSIHELIAVPSSQRIYAASMTGGGVFALEHGAPSFEPANIAGLAALQPNVTGFVVLDLLAQGLPPDRLIVATNGGYALSLDGAEHWQFVSMPGWRPSSLAGSPTQPQNLIGSGAGGLRYSLDGGNIWTPSNGLPQSSETGVIAFAPSAPSTAYAAPVVISVGPGANVPQGIYKSTNGGADWFPVNTGIPGNVGNSITYVGDISVDPRTEQTAYAATSAGLFKTVDGGASWTAVNWAPSASPNTEPLRVAIDSMRPDTVYAARNGLVRRSVDAGVSWDSVASVFPPLLSINALLADPFRTSTLVIGTFSNGAREMTVATDVEIAVDLPSAPLPYGSTPTAHSYTLRNLGLVHASDVQTVIRLPSSAGAVTAAATAGSCMVQGATVTCLQPVLLAGRATQITVSSTHSAAGDVNVQASVQSYEPDTQPSNNSVQATVQVAEVADLSVSVSAPATVTEGNSIAYSVVVTNSGPNVATAVTASVQLAAGLSVATATSSRGSCTPSGSLVTCVVGDLAADSNATIAITTTAASPGTFQATANVAASGFDPASTNNAALVRTTANTLGAGGTPGGSGGVGNAAGGGGGGGGGSTSWPLLVLLISAAVWRRLRDRAWAVKSAARPTR
jgi:uncharacterized repeat protein (TIGR01451 family)